MADASYNALDSNEVAINTDAYHQYISTITAPANSAIGVVTFYSEGTGFFDSCSVISDAEPTIAPPPDSISNKLNNGGFEQSKTSWLDCAAPNLTTISEDAFDGSLALQVENSGCLYQEFPVNPGASYQLLCYAKSAGSLYSSIRLQMADTAYNALDSDEIPVTGNTYRQFSSSIIAPVNSAIGSVTLYSDDTSTFDSCSVEEI